MSARNQATPQAAFGFTRHGNEKSKSAKCGICEANRFLSLNLKGIAKQIAEKSKSAKRGICEANRFLSLNLKEICEANRRKKQKREVRDLRSKSLFEFKSEGDLRSKLLFEFKPEGDLRSKSKKMTK